jgi:hypothetical protein
MKKLLFIAAAFMLSTAVLAQPKAEDLVKFNELKYDFGKLKQGVPATYDFEFKNVSNKPIVVENASATCGCTTPKWPSAPVLSGKTEKVNVGYNAAALGTFTKTISVKLAGVDEPLVLTITGEVLTAAAYETWAKDPKNKSKSSKSGK